MAFSALPIASCRVLPYPDILVPETVAAHFQWWRTIPCTTEYSIPRYSIAIAFVGGALPGHVIHGREASKRNGLIDTVVPKHRQCCRRLGKRLVVPCWAELAVAFD
jgi:hypothetical protein